jgi:hypothetical protein
MRNIMARKLSLEQGGCNSLDCRLDCRAIANHSIEILDFGYPQNTETETLKMYITTEGVKSEKTMVGFHLPAYQD